MGTSRQYMCIPLPSCPVADPTGYAVSVALLPDPPSGEPEDADYKTASWLGGEIVRRPATCWRDEYPDGQYAAYVRIVADVEDVRLPAGRVRIGDTR